VSFGDDPECLEADLRDRFSSAEIAQGGHAFERWFDQVLEYVEAPRGSLDLPLDIRGTAFQRRVWSALKQLPAGATATYGDIAARIGRPNAARAVAGACAANPLALAIPCHRVVRADGQLGGYRWGLERKRELLQRESRPAE
jgi:AraC family transcriptional regulator of adaptative response/methylated-DNA-[protein]-cysteine methyltransferase